MCLGELKIIAISTTEEICTYMAQTRSAFGESRVLCGWRPPEEKRRTSTRIDHESTTVKKDPDAIARNHNATSRWHWQPGPGTVLRHLEHEGSC